MVATLTVRDGPEPRVIEISGELDVASRDFAGRVTADSEGEEEVLDLVSVDGKLYARLNDTGEWEQLSAPPVHLPPFSILIGLTAGQVFYAGADDGLHRLTITRWIGSDPAFYEASLNQGVELHGHETFHVDDDGLPHRLTTHVAMSFFDVAGFVGAELDAEYTFTDHGKAVKITAPTTQRT